jgi:hypothetical protein
LKRQLAAYRTSTKKQRQTITDLEDKLATAYESYANLQNSTPIDIIFGDLCRNRNVDPHGRQYSVETISWAREIQDLSPVAYETVRAILLLPFKRLLRMEFLNCKLNVQQSLTNLSLIDELLRVWSLSNRVNLDTSHPIQVSLSVDAVSIRIMITICQNGEIEGIEDFTKLTSPDLFTQFVLHPRKVQELIHQHWDGAYSSLFVHQVQPLSPELTCCAVHVVNARNDKGNQQRVEKLEEITEILDTKGFQIIGSAFNGDSCFSQLHCQFQHHRNIQTFDKTAVNTFLIEGRNDQQV